MNKETEMKQLIDIETWERRDTYNFFKDFINPTYSTTTLINCSGAKIKAKETGQSFFIYTIYAIAKAVNEIKELRYRITMEQQLFLYDKIDIITPIKVNENGKFVAIRIPFFDNFDTFYRVAKQLIGSVSPDANPFSAEIDKTTDPYSCINISVMPDLHFSSIGHTQQYPHGSPYPLLNVGKAISQNNNWEMPIAINVHHGLVDGHHLSLFYKKVEEYMK